MPLLWLANLVLPCAAAFLAARRNDSPYSHIGDHVPVVFIVMREVACEYSKLRHIEAHHFHHLAALRVCHAGIRLVAIGDGLLQRSYKISFLGLGLLGVASGLVAGNP